MTIIQLPDTYNFSGTIRDIVVDATEKLDFTLSSNGVTIVSETYYPSSDNRITINLRDILEDIIEPVLYDVAETVIPQYTYQIGETTGSFYCIAGGIDAEVSVESYLQGNFLTWQPQTRVTLYHIPHYLRYVSVVESICKVKAFFSDGTSKVAVLKTFSAKSINTVNVTFGTIRGMFESQPTYFDVWVENLEGEMLTWIQRYMLTDFLTGVNDYFIFANSLGGFDTIRFSGDREEINKLDSVNAVFDNETKEYDIDRTRSWKKYTGYITDERIRMWVLDFFNSPCRYHLTDSGLLKRIYISDHKLESTTGDAVGYEFTYVYSVQSRYINIERTSTPPLLEITDPQSEIFFLAPKLNQFELAKIESETDYLFPVQSPMAGKWLAISLKTILDFVSSKGLDVDALQIYLTDHKYATQDWVKEQNYLTSANMDDYVLKKTWDSVFELAEVNGKQVLKIKYDVIGNFGITAYGTGLDSGGSFTGSLVDLVDVSVSGLKTGDILKYNGTHFVNVPLSSISGVSSWEQISGKPDYYPTRWSYIKDAPESLPASDVYPWAKEATKPSYTWDEITDRPTKLSQFQDDVVTGNYVPKATWDSVFELAEVNGQRVLKIKYDVVGNWGITAYGTGPDSGGSFTGSLVDLVDVAVSGLKAGDILKYDGTHFVNVPIASIAGASSWEQISGKPEYFPTRWSYIKDAPESLPASDVYPWAKASTKPSYTWDEITGKPSVFTPDSHTHVWANITDRPTKLSQFQDDVVVGNYVPQTTWDSVFELAEVNGQRVLKIKYDVVGNWGITAYGTGPDSGGSFTGSLVDLVDVAVSGLKAGDILKYDGTHFVNVPIASIGGASSWEQISGKPDYFPTLWSEIKDAPESLPASDVYPWAKAATKPSYTWDEITGKPTAFTPASHTHLWANITDRPTKLSQFQDDVVAGNYFKLSAVRTTDLNDAPINSFFVSSNNPANSPASYTTYAVGLTLALNNDKNFKQQLIYTADNWYYRSQGGGDWYQWHVLWSAANFNPSNKLDKSVWDEAFEIKTVNGIRVISAKLDVLGQKGISAYADSADSGSAGGGLDYELLKNALTGIITPDGYPFTISSKFLGAIDKSYITGKIGDLYADVVHTHKWTDITDRPTSLPANGGNADSAIKLNNSQEFDFSTSAFSYLNLYGPAGSGVLVNDCPTNDWWHILRCLRADVSGYYTDIAVPMGGNAIYWKRVWNGTLQNNGWVKIWDSVNLTKLSQLQDDVVSGNYFKLSANRVTNLNDTPINSFFVSSLGPSNSPVSYAEFVTGFCVASDNNSSYKRQLVYADDWYGRTQNVGTWRGWYKFWHSGNLNPVTIDSDQIITGWKRFNPSTKNGVFNTTGIIENKDTYATPLSWTAKTDGSIWNLQQESDSITLIGIQGGKAIKFLSNPSLTQVIADFFNGTATKAQQDGNGNVIASSYLRLTGGTLTGLLTTKSINANGTVTADRFTGPLTAGYTGNGGQQGPGYIGTNSFGCLMMNTTINGDPTFKDWLICDAYGGSDVGGAIAIGVSRQNMNVFAMSSDADRKTWTRKCQLYTTENANRNSVDWTARNITAAGSVTAPTFVGKLSGASSLLNINNDAGQSSVLQFMQMSTQNEANDLPSNTWHHVLKMNHGNGDTYFSRSLAFSFFDNGIYTRYRSNGTAHEWVALYGGHNANRSDVDWTARNINASETGTFKKLVINGIVIEVVNGNLRVNGNLVATGGVTSQATA